MKDKIFRSSVLAIVGVGVFALVSANLSSGSSATKVSDDVAATIYGGGPCAAYVFDSCNGGFYGCYNVGGVKRTDPAQPGSFKNGTSAVCGASECGSVLQDPTSCN